MAPMRLEGYSLFIAENNQGLIYLIQTDFYEVSLWGD